MSESLTTGTYEVLRNRLRSAAEDLRGRFTQLNAARGEVFGHIETRLLSTLHVTTQHNCVPRDIVALGPHFLLGYNVHFGLKTEIVPSDVFGLFRVEEGHPHEESVGLLDDPTFRRDFDELYRYYKATTFSRFHRAGPLLYAVFQTGKNVGDTKAFKWALAANELRYIDGRSIHELRSPPQHALRWTRTAREQHRVGAHPHISIDDIVFVECVGGDLTIKVEDNTADGRGIYSEPVENADQTLDDAEIYYAVAGNLVLLKIKPYQEKSFRHLIYCVKSRHVLRADGLAQALLLLPDDQGVIFPDGFYLQTGAYKLFDHGLAGLHYEQTVAAPNGEDHLYVFCEPTSGTYLQLRYNIIRQEVDTPLISHGFAFFEDGRMLSMRAGDQPQKHHAVQVWQTPFVGPDYKPQVAADSFLFKVGNRDLVRGMAECQEILQLIDKDESFLDLYADLQKRATDVLDGYFWLDRPEAMNLADPLKAIRDGAAAAIDEYAKVTQVQRETTDAVSTASAEVQAAVASAGRHRFDSVDEFVDDLTKIRGLRGRVIALRELRYVDAAAVDALDALLITANEKLAHRCVEFLSAAESLTPYHRQIKEVAGRVPAVATAAEGREVETRLAETGERLTTLTETVSQLQIDDITVRTAIIDRIGDLLGQLNRVRADLKSRTRELLSGEMQADFAAQTRLLDQSVAAALDTADTPERTDEALARTMVVLEELEGKFADFDAAIATLGEKRESIYAAFETRREQLVEARSRRADTLVAAADRILTAVAKRAMRIEDDNGLRSYLAADPMIAKVRQIADQLESQGETVRGEQLLSRLKTVGDEAAVQLRDRKDLYAAGEGTIRFGSHAFAVNRQPAELTTLIRDNAMALHVTSTQFFEPISEPAIDAAADLWQQLLPSENSDVYRGEFLAHVLRRQWWGRDAENQSSGRHAATTSPRVEHTLAPEPTVSRDAPQAIDAYLSMDAAERVHRIRDAMQKRHDEGYIRGVHDVDCEKILTALAIWDRSLGLLRYTPSARGSALFAWRAAVPAEERRRLEHWVDGFNRIADVLERAEAAPAYRQAVARLLRRHARGVVAEGEVDASAAYLFDQLTAVGNGYASGDADRRERDVTPELDRAATAAIDPRAFRLWEEFTEHLTTEEFRSVAGTLSDDSLPPRRRWVLANDAIEAFFRGRRGSDEAATFDPPRRYRDEIAAMLSGCNGSAEESTKALRNRIPRPAGTAAREAETRSGDDTSPDAICAAFWSRGLDRGSLAAVQLEGMAGDHPRIAGGMMSLHYHRFERRMVAYERDVLPRYRELQAAKHRYLSVARRELRVEEFQARVLTSFVRNQLIDRVYLPLIGTNFGRQIGEAGSAKRSDRSGLLLLLSPPGYGKTTLMEYIANRLGLVFMKINGPALGHSVHSLDPAECTNAAAREELQKLNLALQMGDNVMLYLDDIQHCHPEFLQKFISLCDATRRIEGVWRGEPQTYDLRGRKFAVVMAGNPYTESGERFQIPDMLANRADVYNLGEIIGEEREAFELSYIENSLTSNATLTTLSRLPHADQLAIIRAAERGSAEGLELSQNLAVDRLDEILAVLAKLLRIRDVVLAVNREYIRSAAQSDAYRTEPPFKLQGSYRNMNRIAAKVVPVMNDAELESLINSSYEQDVQTLTRDGESNWLKFCELIGTLTPQQRERWEAIKYAFTERNRLGGLDPGDQVAQVLGSLASLRDGLESIRKAVVQAVQRADGASQPPDSQT